MWGVAAIVAVGYLGHARLAAGAAGSLPNRKWRSPSQAFEPPPRRWPRSARCARPSIPAKGRRRPQGHRRAAQRSRQDAAVAGCSARGTACNAAEQRDHHDARQRLVRQAKGPEAKGAEAKAADKAEPKAARRPSPKAARRRASPRRRPRAREKAGSTPASGSKTSIETGSITQPQIVFGEAVVTRAEQLYAVQLDTATSLDALRTRWGLLVERNGSTLATLQPRYVAPSQGWALPPAGRSPDQPRRCPRHLRASCAPSCRSATPPTSPANRCSHGSPCARGTTCLVRRETCRRGRHALATRAEAVEGRPSCGSRT